MCWHVGKATANQKLYPVGPRKNQHKISSNWWLNPCRPSFQWALAKTWVLLNLTANWSKAERPPLLRQLTYGTSWSSSFFWKPCDLASLRLQRKWSPHQTLPVEFLVLLNRQDGNSQQLSPQHVTVLSWELHGNTMIWIFLKGNWSIDSIFWLLVCSRYRIIKIFITCPMKHIWTTFP